MSALQRKIHFLQKHPQKTHVCSSHGGVLGFTAMCCSNGWIRIYIFIKQLLETPKEKVLVRPSLIISQRLLDFGPVMQLFKQAGMFYNTNRMYFWMDSIHNSILKSVIGSLHSLLKFHIFHLFICSSNTKQFTLCSYFKQIRFCSEFHFHSEICPCRSCERCGHFQQINTFCLNYILTALLTLAATTPLVAVSGA